MLHPSTPRSSRGGSPDPRPPPPGAWHSTRRALSLSFLSRRYFGPSTTPSESESGRRRRPIERESEDPLRSTLRTAATGAGRRVVVRDVAEGCGVVRRCGGGLQSRVQGVCATTRRHRPRPAAPGASAHAGEGPRLPLLPTRRSGSRPSS